MIDKTKLSTVPPADHRTRRRIATLLAATLLMAPSAWAQLPDPGLDGAGSTGKAKKFLGDPIVFVHGCPVPRFGDQDTGSGTNYVTSTLWWKMYEQFRKAGYPADPWPTVDGVLDTTRLPHSPRRADNTGDSTTPKANQYLNILVNQGGQCGSHRQHAQALADYVQAVLAATGAPKVDIVGNSMGALVTRWYIKKLGGARYVRDVALLAGTNHGTNVALLTDPVEPFPEDPLFDPGRTVLDAASDVLAAAKDAGAPREINDPADFRSPNYDGAREASPAYSCDPFAYDDAGLLPPSIDARKTFQQELNGCEGVDELLERAPADENATAWINLYNHVFDELHLPTQTSCLNQKFPNDCSDPINEGMQNDEEGLPHGEYRLFQPVIDRTFGHLSRRKQNPS